MRLVFQGDAGDRVRFDAFLAEKAGLSRADARRLIENGRALLDGAARAPDWRLRGGEIIEVAAPGPKAAAELPGRRPAGALKSRVLHEDKDLLVLDKPAGLLMHPLAATWLAKPRAACWEAEENLAALLQAFRPGIERCPRCGIVHRLDRMTSGVLLVAKSLRAFSALLAAFKEREVSKIYRAIVAGVPSHARTSVEAPVGRPPGRRRVSVTPLGRASSTGITVRSACACAALVEAAPMTGRTHQIRAHLAHIGHPVLGDPEMKPPAGIPAPPRMMLHAWRIRLAHPVTGREVRFEAPVPRDFRDYWSILAGRR